MAAKEHVFPFLWGWGWGYSVAVQPNTACRSAK